MSEAAVGPRSQGAEGWAALPKSSGPGAGILSSDLEGAGGAGLSADMDGVALHIHSLIGPSQVPHLAPGQMCLFCRWENKVKHLAQAK